jgi:hypothetical protein
MANSQPLLHFLRRFPLVCVCTVLLLVLAALFVVRMGLLPQQEEILNQRKAEGENMLANLRNAAGLEQQLEQLRSIVALAESRLIRSEDLARNLQVFYRIESETGAKIVLLRQNTGPVTATTPAAGARPAQAPANAYRPVAFTLIVEGTFVQTLDFLRQIERGPHLFRLGTFTVQRGSGDGFAGSTVVLNINLEFLGAS